MSYILMRNLFAASAGKKIGEYRAADVERITIQTLNKVSRDYGITASKVIFLYDRWDKELGGYFRTHILKGDYKSTRVYINEEEVEKMRQDPTVTPEKLAQAELEAYRNKVRYEAKWGMVREFKNIGIPCAGVEGWEFDDFAWLASCLLYNEDPSVKPSIIITKDSDLQYSLTPKMDYFKLPTKGSAPKVITYNEMYYTIPEYLRGSLTLYQYKSYLDSLGEGHNDMTKTLRPGADPNLAIKKILEGDYSDVTDKEVFDRQMLSFDISKFPRFDKVKSIIENDFDKMGKLGTVEDFRNYCNRRGVSQISDNYYREFISRFDPTLFKG